MIRGTAKTQNEMNTRMRTYLREQRLRPGDQLPGERDLASALGVGRAALRPVLEALEAEGVLIRRPQSGTFLAAVPAPDARGATVALIAPFHGTGEPGREADPGWLHRVVSAFERVAVPACVQLLPKDQSPRAGDPCSVKDMAREAADEGARAAVLLHPVGTRAKIAHALALLHDRGVHPVIVSSRTYPGLASQVYFDSGWGAYLATRHLLKRGHRRIGFAGAPGGHEWVQERILAYASALEAAEIEQAAGWVWLPDQTERLTVPEDGAAYLGHWLSLPPAARPTGVVAASDVVAVGLLAAAGQCGVSVPGDLSVVGFDNNPDALFAGLTTVERPTEALGEAVAQVTLERLAAGPEAATVTLRLRPVLIERATVGPPAKDKTPLTKE